MVSNWRWLRFQGPPVKSHAFDPWPGPRGVISLYPRWGSKGIPSPERIVSATPEGARSGSGRDYSYNYPAREISMPIFRCSLPPFHPLLKRKRLLVMLITRSNASVGDEVGHTWWRQIKHAPVFRLRYSFGRNAFGFVSRHQCEMVGGTFFVPGSCISIRW